MSRSATWSWLALLLVGGCGEGRDIDLQLQREPDSWEVLASDDGVERRRDPRTGVVFVRVPSGSFTMGGASEIDTPRHRVRISRPFWLAETEVTVGQWRIFVRRDGGPADTLPPADADDALPVGGVSWNDAMAFCDAYGYALPTEAQWEYACRAGDDAVKPDRAAIIERAWVYPNAADHAHPVGTRPPNAFGLHDMLGNLWEWSADGFLPRYVVADQERARVDPAVPAGEGAVAIRGGSWFSVPLPWPSDRMYGEPDLRTPLFGFRVAWTAHSSADR